MTKFIKDQVKQIQISGIRQFNQKASQVDGVIKLTLGELDFNTFDNIKKATIDAINQNKTRYTVNAGILELREKIADRYTHYNADEIIVTVGTTEGLSIVIKSVINPGDEVIIPTPGYVGYEPLIQIEQGKVIPVDLTHTHFRITKESLESAYSNQTKAMIITNPNNPTGIVLTDTEMDIIKAFVLEKDILLIVDEIYSEIDFNHRFKSFSQYKELKNHMIILNGFSKSHAMTGLRIGYLLSDRSLINELIKTHQYSVTSATSISQYAALFADYHDTQKIVNKLVERRNYLTKSLDDLKIDYVKPEGAFYLFINIKKFGYTSTEFCEKLLYEGKVAMIPGKAFLGGHDDYVRLSFAASLEDIKEAIKRITHFIKNL